MNRMVRQRFTGLSTVVLAACLGVGLLSAPSRAAEPRPLVAAVESPRNADAEARADEPGGPAAQALTAPSDEAGHADRAALKPADRAPCPRRRTRSGGTTTSPEARTRVTPPPP